MEKSKNIIQYRNRLDKTLASHELTDVETLKELVRGQVLRSLECELEDSIENMVEKRTQEVFDCLQMLSPNSENDEVLQSRDANHRSWKLKQDTEEYRVMYREGPKGTPFHELLVEGYVEGPLDVCLCISWESNLYRKWWPQSSIPTFKILSSRCLQKVRIGEQISLVRAKVSWPLSAREAIVHFFEFEYFQGDLIVVLFNSISDSESIDSQYGFSKDAIPDKQDVVRMDLIGGMAMQKVTATRSYFRILVNMDMKLDLVPPSIINFISRQLIGSGFRLYQKEVASVCRGDEDFRKALEDPLHSRIREALYSDIKQNENLELENGKATSPEDQEDVDCKTIGEIEEIEEEPVESRGELVENENETDNLMANDKYNVKEISCNGNKSEVGISPQVKQALETLEKAISLLREYRSSDPDIRRSSNSSQKRAVEVKSSEEGKICRKDGVSGDVSNEESMERTREPRSSCGSRSSRRTGSSSYVREANHSRKIVPASPEVNLVHLSEAQHTALHSDFSFHKNGEEASLIIDKNYVIDRQLSDGIISSSKAKHGRLRRFCCLHFSSGQLLS